MALPEEAPQRTPHSAERLKKDSLLEIHTDPEWMRPMQVSRAAVTLPENVSAAALGAIESDLDAALTSQGYAPGGVPRFGMFGYFLPADRKEITLSWYDSPVDRNLVSQVERIVAVNTNQDPRVLIVPFPEGTSSQQSCDVSHDVHAYLSRRSLHDVSFRVHGTHILLTADSGTVPRELAAPLENIVEMNTTRRNEWQGTRISYLFKDSSRYSAIMPTAHLYDA